MPFCQNCGALNEEGSNFCKQCGSKIIIKNNKKEDYSEENNITYGKLIKMIPFFIFIGLILIFLIYAYGWGFLIIEILVIVILIVGYMFNGNG